MSARQKKEVEAVKRNTADVQKKNLTIHSEHPETVKSRDFLHCTADVSGQPLTVVIDTGAQDNYVSNTIPHLKTTEIMPTNKVVELANGHKVEIRRKVKL